MIVSLVLLAVIMATIVGWLLRQTLNTEPWISNPVDNAVSGASLAARTKTLGLIAFLAVVTSLFALFISAYLMRRHMGDWNSLPEPKILWANSGVLILACIAYHWTRAAAVAGRTARLKPGLAVAGALTFLFLAGQLLAWRQLYDAGYYLAANPAYAFFYVLTAVHGLHLVGGLWVWARSMFGVMTGADAEGVRVGIELCTVYWHYLLLVWVVLFGLLLAT